MDTIFKGTKKKCPCCGKYKVSKYKLLLVCDCGWYEVKGRPNYTRGKSYKIIDGKRVTYD